MNRHVRPYVIDRQDIGICHDVHSLDTFSGCGELSLPAIFQTIAELLLKLGRKIFTFSLFAQLDGHSQPIQHYPTIPASFEMCLELATELRIKVTIDKIRKLRNELMTIGHSLHPRLNSRPGTSAEPDGHGVSVIWSPRPTGKALWRPRILQDPGYIAKKTAFYI